MKLKINLSSQLKILEKKNPQINDELENKKQRLTKQKKAQFFEIDKTGKSYARLFKKGGGSKKIKKKTPRITDAAEIKHVRYYD